MIGKMKFESSTSDFLECSCGNTVMRSGFTTLDSNCESQHFACVCGAIACVDFSLRVANNIDAEQAGVTA